MRKWVHVVWNSYPSIVFSSWTLCHQKHKETKDTGRSDYLIFGHPTDQGAALLVSRPSPSSTHPEEEPTCDSYTEQVSATLNSPQEKRGDVASWWSFAKSKWSSKHPWLVIQPNGVYCRYCSHTGSFVRNGSVVFIAEPFTGCWPDKLAKHKQGKTHQQNEEAYWEWQAREASMQILPTIFMRLVCKQSMRMLSLTDCNACTILITAKFAHN